MKTEGCHKRRQLRRGQAQCAFVGPGGRRDRSADKAQYALHTRTTTIYAPDTPPAGSVLSACLRADRHVDFL